MIPDFLVRSEDRTIGVEMQEFIQGAGKDGAPARQAEGVRDAIMGKAQAQFEARNPGSYPHVYPYWVRPVSGQIRTPRDLPARICALVESVVREPAQEGDVMTKRDVSYPDLEAAGLEGWLTHLTVYLYAPATYGLWSSSEWGYVSQDLLALADQVREGHETARVPCCMRRNLARALREGISIGEFRHGCPRRKAAVISV